MGYRIGQIGESRRIGACEGRESLDHEKRCLLWDTVSFEQPTTKAVTDEERQLASQACHQCNTHTGVGQTACSLLGLTHWPRRLMISPLLKGCFGGLSLSRMPLMLVISVW